MESINWKTYEYSHDDKTPDWYWAVGIISLAIAITSVILDNILFAIFILVGAFSLALHVSKKPALVDFSINKKGVSIDNRIYSYPSLESFWFEEDELSPKVILKSKKLMMPLIILPAEKLDPEEVVEFLGNFLPEEELHEPVGQKLLEYLGF